jgi:predicted transglutaminase-like cysteine proteinase
VVDVYSCPQEIIEGNGMRPIAKILVSAATTAAVFWGSASQAAFSSLSHVALKFQLTQIVFDTPALPPMGHSRFCLHYADDCKVHGIDFRHRNIALTAERWTELNLVNREVNRDIVPKLTSGDGTTEAWLISPKAGDCKDYAITKRHKLLARGWPSRALLLSEVIVPSGEHHLILVVRTTNADLVLDNLNPNIQSVAMTLRRYQWVRIESPQNPKYWAVANLSGPKRTLMAFE